MITPFRSSFLSPTKEFRRLSIMLAIHDDPAASQHRIARITHLSSSMVNNYVKKLQLTGQISVSGRTNRTQSYHLTESGRSELMSMLMGYSAEIVQFYSAVKHEVGERLSKLHADGISKVALFGAAETAEVVHTVIKDTPLAVVAVVDSDPNKQGERFNGLIVQEPKALKEKTLDAVVITSFGKQNEIHRCIRQLLGGDTKVVRLSDM